LDSNAISVGYAIQSGVILQKCFDYWCKLGTSQVVNSSLINSISSNVVSLIENYQYNNCSSWINQAKGESKGINACSVSGNGLMYDNCEGTKQRSTSADSYCSSKGMRLPDITETRAWSSSGVPSCSSWTWTSSYESPGMYGYFLRWEGSSTYKQYQDQFGYVRCVK
jgi:hypothetical protein